MNILNDVLAFASYMVILSTLVSAIIELIFHVRSKRQVYFDEIISRLFDDVIWRRFGDKLTGPHKHRVLGEKIRKDTRKEFLKAMASVTGLKTDNPPSRTYWEGEKKTERLTSVEFATRFAKTRSGKIIHAFKERDAEIIIADLVRSFEDLSVGSTSDFHSRARKWSLWVGFLLSFVMNIDSFQLFKQLNNDPEVAAQVIAATSKTLEKKHEPTGEDINAIKESLSLAGYAGLPIGWDYFPFCNESKVDQRCLKDVEDEGVSNVQDGMVVSTFYDFFNENHHYVFWFLGVLSTGIFVGLGSPFWFQVFQRMSVAVQLVRGLSSPKEQHSDNAMAGNVTSDSLKPFEESIAAFKLAAEAEAILSSEDSPC